MNARNVRERNLTVVDLGRQDAHPGVEPAGRSIVDLENVLPAGGQVGIGPKAEQDECGPAVDEMYAQEQQRQTIKERAARSTPAGAQSVEREAARHAHEKGDERHEAQRM